MNKIITIAACMALPLSPFVLLAIRGVFPMVSAKSLILGCAAAHAAASGTACVVGNVLHEL